MPTDEKAVKILLSEDIEIPQVRAFKFQVKLYDESMDKFKPPFAKYALFFEFDFSDDISYKIPMILLNSNEYYEELTYNWVN